MAEQTTQPLIQAVTHVTVQVRDQEKAKAWYTEKFGFEVRNDVPMENGLRWITVAPPGTTSPELALMPPQSAPGDPSPPGFRSGPVIVLQVADCRTATETLERRGVQVVSPAEDVPWGVSSIVRDLDGNPYNLVESRPMA